MSQDKIIFHTQTATIVINMNECIAAKENTSEPSCGFMCVKACRLYGRNVLKIENNKPALTVSEPEAIKRLDNECLACEFYCMLKGSSCIKIDVPLEGIDNYRKKMVSR